MFLSISKVPIDVHCCSVTSNSLPRKKIMMGAWHLKRHIPYSLALKGAEPATTLTPHAQVIGE